MSIAFASLLSPALLAATSSELGSWKWTDLPAGWVLTLFVILVFFGLRALYRAERGRANLPMRLGLAAVRTLVLFLLLLVIAGPYREEVRTAEERSHLVILVDASGSMGMADRHPPDEIARLREVAWGEGAVVSDEDVSETARLDLVKRVLAPEGESLLRDLDRRFVLHIFAFDVDWRGIGSSREDTAGDALDPESAEDPVDRMAEGIRALKPEGGGTDLGSVLQSVAAEFLGREDRRLAGVLLITDGRDTSDGDGPVKVVESFGITRADLHLTPIALGNASSGRNVRVERIRAMDWVLIEDDVVFETAIRHEGFTGLDGVRAVTTITQVADAQGKPLDTPRIYEPPEGAVLEVGPMQLGTPEEPAPVRVKALMRVAGTFKVRIEAILPPEDARLDSVKEDDASEHTIRVVDQRIKVLYVDNYPRYELRFLRNWLTREPTADPSRPDHRRRYETHTLLQSADPTVTQVASPGTTPLKSFPTTRREIFSYDVILLGDVDWIRLGTSTTESQRILELLRDFVEEGGGLALQAGASYKNPRDFRDTPLMDVLPIVVRDRDETASEEVEIPLRLHLTDIGMRHPIFGVVPGRDGGLASPEEMVDVWAGRASWAPFARDWKWYWMYRSTGGLRPGAMGLARARPDPAFEHAGKHLVDDTGRPYVAMATMGFGKGRVFWSSLDALWRLRRGQSDRYYGPFWDQVIRYLATYRLLGGNKRYKISTDKEQYFAGETATVTITALDREFEPLADPTLEGLHVEDPDKEDTLLTGEQAPRNLLSEGAAPGTYRAWLPLRKKGTYRLWISDAGRSREFHGHSRAERRVEVVFRAPELRHTEPDHEVLKTLATETDGQQVNGRVARLYDLADLAREMPARSTARIVDRRERTQWDRPWVLLLLIGLLGLEWALRKRSHMI